jgi:glycosyltransferase involved in cell wall biosynthesis
MVPPADSQAIALAIVRLLADQPLRMSLVDNGLQTAGSYAWSKVTSQVMAVYEQSVFAAAGARWRQE